MASRWRKSRLDGRIVRATNTTHKGVADTVFKALCVRYFIVTVFIPADTVDDYTCCGYVNIQIFPNSLPCLEDGTCIATIESKPQFGAERLVKFCDGDYLANQGIIFAGGDAHTGQLVIPDCQAHGWQADTIYAPSVASPSATYSCFSRVDEICYPTSGTPRNSCYTSILTVASDYTAAGPCRGIIDDPAFWDGYEGCVPSALS